MSQSLAAKETVLLCVKAAIEKKAMHSIVFQVGALGSFTEYFLITSSTNERQSQAIADSITKAAKAAGLKPRVEGYDEGRWILIDLIDVVVHVFHESIREFYDLDTLWAEAPRLAIPKEFFLIPQQAESGNQPRQQA